MDGSKDSHRQADTLSLHPDIIFSCCTRQYEFKYQRSDESTCRDGFERWEELELGSSDLDCGSRI